MSENRNVADVGKLVLLVNKRVTKMTLAEMDRTAEPLKSLASSHSVVMIERDVDFVWLPSPIK